MKGLTHEESKQLREKARQYKAEGHTAKDVAEKFGLSLGYAKQICKGIAPQKPDMRGRKINRWTSKSMALREAKAIKTINKHLPGFEYVGGFTHSDGYVDLKCKECGAIFSRSLIGIRHGNGVKCPECFRIIVEQNRIKAEEEKRQKRLKTERKRIVRRWANENNGTQMFMKSCKECGRLFYTWRKPDCYCSDACRRKVVNRYKDNRLNESNIIDKDITLSKLYNRDSGKCYLCGCVCDWEDKEIDDNGNVIVGGNYPTIEHVYPLSKGGLHAWHNVKLACKKCNENKRDNIPPVASVS